MRIIRGLSWQLGQVKMQESQMRRQATEAAVCGEDNVGQIDRNDRAKPQGKDTTCAEWSFPKEISASLQALAIP